MAGLLSSVFPSALSGAGASLATTGWAAGSAGFVSVTAGVCAAAASDLVSDFASAFASDLASDGASDVALSLTSAGLVSAAGSAEALAGIAGVSGACGLASASPGLASSAAAGFGWGSAGLS